MDIYRLLVVGILIAIVASLGSALYHLSASHGDSSRMVRALTWRIALSVALFLLLMLGWFAGLIRPHELGR